jgi:hypothetical protein
MDRGQIFGTLDIDNDSLSGDSSGSDSESDVEGQSEPITVRENETSERQLTLFDDENDNPLLPMPPECDGEGKDYFNLQASILGQTTRFLDGKSQVSHLPCWQLSRNFK